MQFYKFEGFIVDENWSEENDSQRIMREKTKRIARKSNAFNEKLQKKAFFYVTDASGDLVTIGIICRDSADLDRRLAAFLNTIEIELKDTYLEEVTFNSARKMLILADRNDYIENDDNVLEQFDLDRLSLGFQRSIEYDENIIKEADKKYIYKKAESFIVKDTFMPELDRIYAGSSKKNVTGHPVHYMLQTDDDDIREGIGRLLLQALYANNRIRNRRYSLVEFRPDGNFDIRPGFKFSPSAYDCLYKSNTGGAIIVRYHANDDIEDEFASSGRETIEIICEAMKRYRHQVLTVFCLPRECTKSKEIFYENLGNSSFVELKEEFVYGEDAKDFLKVLAKDKGMRVNKKLFEKLEEEKGYLAPELHKMFDEWYNNKLKTGIYPQYKEIITAKREVIKAAPKGSAYDELMEMVGLENVKELINNALNYYKAQKLFADKGMKANRTAMHMVFTGNPGTAKTTVARLFARIMKENGLLSKRNLVEVGRADMVGKYVGWTAPTVKKKFKEAEGSVLFIDEAYSLVDGRDGLYGDEAINTIVQEMENRRDSIVVIFAGYPDKMEGFLQKNPGLRSRIAFHIPFADYDAEDLCGIAGLIAKKKGLTFTKEACDKLFDVFEIAKNEDDFGNGRYVRNVIEKAKMAQATRLLTTMDYDDISEKDLRTIYAEDIEMPTAPKRSNNRIGFGT
ncbi:MAG: AAA family ATPase [Ruminococcaceae bacterium]|nr:AAA family ATPase [Oscillospiraceae bacterium]